MEQTSAVHRAAWRAGFRLHPLPEFINGANLEEIYWLVKERGFATIQRAADSDLLHGLLEEGDVPGALWKQGLFEGADPR